MQRALEFYFYIGSTYTYLAVNRAEALAGLFALRFQSFTLIA